MYDCIVFKAIHWMCIKSNVCKQFDNNWLKCKYTFFYGFTQCTKWKCSTVSESAICSVVYSSVLLFIAKSIIFSFRRSENWCVCLKRSLKIHAVELKLEHIYKYYEQVSSNIIKHGIKKYTHSFTFIRKLTHGLSSSGAQQYKTHKGCHILYGNLNR